jgi:CubicO group peptidase (beta-lactamase class C family)
MPIHKRLPAVVIVLSLACSPVAAEERWSAKDWPTATPESVGLDGAVLAALDADIAAGTFPYVDSMLVIREGKAVFERSYAHDYDAVYGPEAKGSGPLVLHHATGPYNYLNTWWHPFYRRGELHTLQSATKTVMSVAIGAAVARHEFPDVDTPMLKFFEGRAVAHADDRKRRVTIRHLLTMTSGMEWREDVPFSDPQNSAHAMEESFDWVQYAIDRPMQHEPGQAFHYSSGTSQILAHIFHRATGQDIEEYTARHVFAPLGIDHYYWKRTPCGIANTEGGLYLRPSDLAKIGYLFLEDGAWAGRLIVTPEWVKASTAPAATASESSGVKYGYQWWLVPHGEDARLAWAMAGWGGQMLIVVPEQDLVLVFTGWNIWDDTRRLRPLDALERVLRAVRR